MRATADFAIHSERIALRAAKRYEGAMVPDIDAVIAAQTEWQHAYRSSAIDAERSATTALTRAAESLDTLRANLRTIGFPVPAPVVLEDIDGSIATIEKALGFSVPPLLQLLWRTLGEISFVDLKDYSHAKFWSSRGIVGPNHVTDALCLYGCTDAWTKWMCIEIEEDEEDLSTFPLELAPDSFHKDDISGGSPYSVAPSTEWSVPLNGFSWMAKVPASNPASRVDLLTYLRTTVLECAGFPGLLGVEAFEPIRLRLLEGVRTF